MSRAYELELERAQEQPMSPTGATPASDTLQSGPSVKQRTGVPARVLFGRIVDAIAYAHVYKVNLENGMGIVLASASLTGSTSIIGAKSVNTYTPGTPVLVWLSPLVPFPFIICAIPDFIFDGTSALSDMWVKGGNVGLRTDAVHQFPFSLNKGGGIADMSSGRPFDSLPIGEWGAMAETGLACLLDPFQGSFRVDEETGLFIFYHDQLTRLAGHNLQIWSAGFQRNDEDDENEWDSVEGWSPYLWEQRGALIFGTSVTKTYSPSDTQVNQPWYAGTEPISDTLIPFHRRTKLRGYLGQGGADLVAVPPEGGSLFDMAMQQQIPGVYEFGVALDGQVGIRSAKGIVISKRPLAPLPMMQKTADDPDGDTSANYKANGVYGNGPDHKVGDIFVPSPNDHQIRAAAAIDAYDYLFNWKTFRHTFNYHTLDWYIPQETAMPNAGSMASGIPSYGNLAGQQYLQTPPSFPMQVDSRYGNVLYFPNNAYIALLEDGGILFVDGWGSEFLMSAGSIRLSAAGDIWELAGRNINHWAGWDLIGRGNNEVNLSANWGHLRVSAGASVLGLAGNRGCGGFLWESRATQTVEVYDANNPIVTGFVVRCKHSPIALMAKDILVSTLALGTNDANSHIVLEAGVAKIIEHANVIEERADLTVMHVLGGSTVNEFWATENNFGAAVSVDGKLDVNGCVLATTTITAGTLMSATNYMQNDAGVTAAVATMVSQVSGRAATASAYAASSEDDRKELVNNTDVETVEFEWRDKQDYKTEQLAVFEPRWQQIARLTGQSLHKWTEFPSTDDVGNITYPHPGKGEWLEGNAYNMEDLNLHNQTTDLAEDRGGAYESPQLQSPTQSNLDGTWVIIMNPC
jgi:hypothetical protein